MNRLLIVAFHFPPLSGSSGIQRTLRFARYLPEFGWEPVILTAHPRAYENVAGDQLADIPEGIEVVRAPAWDTARHFSIAGRYPGWLARPDRWISWWAGGVPAGLSLIRRYAPGAIWSSYPIATAHCIGATLRARSGLPWVADFRDPMAQEDYPEDPATWRSFDRIERQAIQTASIATFTTPSALRLYQERYPDRAGRMFLVENGYDEEAFADARDIGILNPDRLTVLHSGIVYPSERDPTQLFAALAQLKAEDPVAYGRLVVRFRAPVHDELLRRLATEFAVEDAIEVLPAVGYRDALDEMMAADGLLVLQAANCNAQIPAKLYEYLRTRRPVLALTDPSGDTAKVVNAAGISAVAALDDAEAIKALIARFIATPSAGTTCSGTSIEDASRRARTRQLAQLLDTAIGGRPS